MRVTLWMWQGSEPRDNMFFWEEAHVSESFHNSNVSVWGGGGGLKDASSRSAAARQQMAGRQSTATTQRRGTASSPAITFQKLAAVWINRTRHQQLVGIFEDDHK